MTQDILIAQGKPEESRTERAAVTLTPSEKKALAVVAMARDTDESNLLRTSTIPDIMAEYDAMVATLPPAA